MVTKNNERLLPNWIGGFLQYTSGMPSASIFRQWAAISTLSAALTRRVWTEADQSRIFPNMMTFLVGDPSTGKGFAIKVGQRLLHTIDYSHSDNPIMKSKGIRMGTDSTTGAGLFDECYDDLAIRIAEYGNAKIDFRSLVVVAEESATFFSDIDLKMMGRIIKFANCDDRTSERLRKDGVQKHIDRPVLAILAGIQPKVLDRIFPEEAWSMGLLARMNFVVSNEVVKVPAFGSKQKPDSELFEALQRELAIIANLTGPFLYSEDAASIINTWWLEKADKDRPTHPRLMHYTSKRLEHLIRLCMVNSVARTNSLIVEEDDVTQALSVLYQVEAQAPDMFANIVSEHSNHMAMEDAKHQVEAIFRQTGKPIPNYMLMGIIGKKVASGQAGFVLDQMKAQRMITEIPQKQAKRLPGPGGNRAYIPYVEPRESEKITER